MGQRLSVVRDQLALFHGDLHERGSVAPPPPHMRRTSWESSNFSTGRVGAVGKETTGSAETFYLFHGPSYFGKMLVGFTEMLATESDIEGWERFTPFHPVSLLPLLLLPCPPSFHLSFLPYLLECLLHARNAATDKNMLPALLGLPFLPTMGPSLSPFNRQGN